MEDQDLLARVRMLSQSVKNLESNDDEEKSESLSEDDYDINIEEDADVRFQRG